VAISTDTNNATTASSLVQQCDAYLQYVYKRELDTLILNQGMINTSFMSWNQGTQYCRDFNANLRCILIDQLHCHSDRDKFAFPFALYINQMGGLGSTTEYTKQGRQHRTPVDNLFNRQIHDLNFVQEILVTNTDDRTSSENEATETTTTRKQDMVRIIRDRLHWTYRSLGPQLKEV